MESGDIVEKRTGSRERRLLCPMKFGNPALGDSPVVKAKSALGGLHRRSMRNSLADSQPRLEREESVIWAEREIIINHAMNLTDRVINLQDHYHDLWVSYFSVSATVPEQ